tara:strand:+ start:258 stop:560 length:303 start_codon:yes stop_codon:yes gene_type:complete
MGAKEIMAKIDWTPAIIIMGSFFAYSVWVKNNSTSRGFNGENIGGAGPIPFQNINDTLANTGNDNQATFTMIPPANVSTTTGYGDQSNSVWRKMYESGNY